MLRIVDRYILKKFLTTFLFITGLITLIAALVDFTEKNDQYVKHALSAQEIAGYYVVFLPFIVNLIMPITVFITTVFVTAQLAQRTEIIAILSSGISYQRFLRPFLFGAALIALFNFSLTGWVLAGANKNRVAFEEKYIPDLNIRNRLKSENPPPVHVAVSPTTYLGMERYYTQYHSGKNATLETLLDGQVIEKITARYIQWMPAERQWKFQYWHKRKLEGLQEHIEHGDSLLLPLQLDPADFRMNPRLGETLTLPQLNAHIKLLKSKGIENLHVFYVEKYVRYMSPIALLILTLLGIVVASRKARGGMGLQIAFGFVLAIVYIALFLMVKGLAEARGTHLLLIIWAPNMLFSLLGGVLYRLTPK